MVRIQPSHPIKQTRPPVKLHEITRIAEYEPDPSTLERVLQLPNRTQVDMIENHPVFKTQVGDSIVYDVDGKAAVIGKMEEYANRWFFHIGQVYVFEKYRKQGFATILYKCLAVRLRLNLMSDSLLTPGSIALWKSLVKTADVQTFDLKTHEITDIQSIHAAITGLEKDVLVSINESRHPVSQHHGILAQLVHYTSKDQEGLWE